MAEKAISNENKEYRSFENMFYTFSFQTEILYRYSSIIYASTICAVYAI